MTDVGDFVADEGGSSVLKERKRFMSKMVKGGSGFY